jgi:hypothetical protein
MPMKKLGSLSNIWHKRVLIGFGVYVLLFFISGKLVPFVPSVLTDSKIGLGNLFWFSIVWLVLTVGFFALLLRKKFRVEWKVLYMYVGMMAMIGPVGELFINAVYRNFFGGGVSLWTYVVYPIH